MTYPGSLLPKASYRLIDFDATQSQSYFLIRHTTSTDVIDDNRQLKAESVSFQTDHLRDYSINLLGEFQPDDVNWQWLCDTNCTNEWLPGDGEVQKPVVGIDVEKVEGRGRFFLQIVACHNARFVIETPIGKQEAIGLVRHTPTRGNFWHCSLRWLSNGQDSLNLTKSQRRHILSAARNFIIQNALLTEPMYQAIPPSAYQ